MINAPYENEFVFLDGRRAKNILELNDILERLSDEDFQSFVNPRKNDFANWIEAILLDKKLAERLRSTLSKDQTIIIVSKRLAELSEEEKAISASHSVHSIIKSSDAQNYIQIMAPAHKIEPRIDIVDKGAGQNPDQNTSNPRYPISEINEKPEMPLKNPQAGFVHSDNAGLYHEEHSDNGIIKPFNKPVNKWYSFFNKDQSNRHVHADKNESKEHNKKGHDKSKEYNAQSQTTPDEGKSGGNLFWITIYVVLILAIIFLLIYKFFLSR